MEDDTDLREQLMHACKSSDLSKMRYLVEVQHVDPHLCLNGKNDDTPLHWASNYGHLDIVRYLVEEKSCDMECRNQLV